MKRIISVIIVWVAVMGGANVASAQETVMPDTTQLPPLASDALFMRIGYLSYDSALHAMPDYAIAQQQMAELTAQYEAELKRVEDDFNRKYEEFLEGQRDFPKTILNKRQTELKELMDRNVAFRQQSKLDLKEAERETIKPLRSQLNAVIARIARERGLAIVVNTDSEACPFIEPLMSEDINQLVRDALR